MLSLAVLVGGCATNPSNLSWEERPQILLPPLDSQPPPVAPRPADADTPASTSPELEPGSASLPLQVVEALMA